MSATSYPATLQDWKGVFIRHQANALAQHVDIDLSLWAPPGDNDARIKRVTSPDDENWLAALMDSGGIAHLLRGNKLKALSATLKLLRMQGRAYRQSDCDLYHVNWLQNALALPKDNKPALITVLGTDFQLLKLPFMASALRHVMASRACVICPNAQWMVEPLQKKLGEHAQVVALPFGIDASWFALYKKRLAERQTAVEREQHWLAVFRLTKAKLGPLFEWAEPLFANGARQLHLFGPMQEQCEIPDWVNYHGAASPEQLRSEWFAQATGMITLSQHAEGRPQVLLESMASGLPIVASTIPAHADFIVDGLSGWLVDSPHAFATAITQTEQAEHGDRIADNAHDWVKNDIGTWQDCANKYYALYEQLLLRSSA